MSRLNMKRRGADYQRAYRQQQIALRKPTRDDVARVALHLMITEALSNGRDGELDELCDTLVTRLEAQGFSKDGAYRRVDQLVERFASGWGPQRKPHLTRSSAD
uniref:Uncharacterized protein n=1 Tax=Rhodopseudomonas palustris (strain BisA53) TaxID=316055 RepID=Q07SK3_RHOP5